MKLFRKQRLFGISLVLIFSGLVALTSFFTLKQIKKETTENTLNSLQTVLFTVKEGHAILIRQFEMETETLSKSPQVVNLTQQLLMLHKRKVPTQASQPLEELRELVSPVLEKLSGKGFFVIAPDHISIASMRDKNLDTINLIQHQKAELLSNAFSGFTTFIPTIRSDIALKKEKDPDHRPVTMFVTAPIRDKYNNIIAVFALRIDPLQHFSNIARLGRIGESGETYAFDSQGTLLTESRFFNQLLESHIITKNQSDILNLRIADPGRNLLTNTTFETLDKNLPLTRMAASATQGHSGFDMEGYRDYRGVMVFGAWLWDRDNGFGLATEINVEEALQSYYRTRTNFIRVIASTLFLGLMMLLIITRVQKESTRRLQEANDALETSVQQRTQELVNARDELAKANQELEVLATTDALTGLSNRRYFDDTLEREWQRCLRDKKTISIILFDIDCFKQLNDTYGHLIGDNCLKVISDMLRASQIATRPGDCIARFGGEEFIILLSQASSEYVYKVSHDIRDKIDTLEIANINSNVKDKHCVTVSVGFATECDLSKSHPDALIKKADDALYKAKNSGKNIVCSFRENSVINNDYECA